MAIRGRKRVPAVLSAEDIYAQSVKRLKEAATPFAPSGGTLATKVFKVDGSTVVSNTNDVIGREEFDNDSSSDCLTLQQLLGMRGSTLLSRVIPHAPVELRRRLQDANSFSVFALRSIYVDYVGINNNVPFRSDDIDRCPMSLCRALLRRANIENVSEINNITVARSLIRENYYVAIDTPDEDEDEDDEIEDEDEDSDGEPDYSVKKGKRIRRTDTNLDEEQASTLIKELARLPEYAYTHLLDRIKPVSRLLNAVNGMPETLDGFSATAQYIDHLQECLAAMTRYGVPIPDELKTFWEARQDIVMSAYYTEVKKLKESIDDAQAKLDALQPPLKLTSNARSERIKVRRRKLK